MINMYWFNDCWGLAPIHHRKWAFETYNIHKIWRHIKGRMPSIFLSCINLYLLDQIIREQLFPIKSKTLCNFMNYRDPIYSEIGKVFLWVQSTKNHSYVHNVCITRSCRNYVMTICFKFVFITPLGCNYIMDSHVIICTLVFLKFLHKWWIINIFGII